MNEIELNGITSHYDQTRVLDDVTFRIAQGELHTLLGPSGCGKTTLLRLLGGFLQPTAGRIFLDGREITSLPPEKRNMGIVFQNYALFPHLNVEENVAYGLKLHRINAAQVRETVRAQLDLMGLWECRTRKIQELSGGQQQRVAIARALAASPRILLLDEPMSNLDVSLRIKMRQELRQIQQKVGVTTLFITHDQQEALAISDTMSVMHDGRIEQTGSPREIYESPKTSFVATFVGKTNMLDRAAMTALGGHGEAETSYLRPEQLVLEPVKTAQTPLPGQVIRVHYQGAMVEYEVKTDAGILCVLALNNHRGNGPVVGGAVFAGLRP